MTDLHIATITPQIAATLLRANTCNRPVSRMIVANYAEMMASGQWKLNGETIKVTSKGVLLDGQHRLLACVQSGTAFRAYYVEVEDDTVFDTIDVGKKRSGSDILAIKGEKQTSLLAAVLPLVRAYYKTGKLNVNSRRCNNMDLEGILEEHPDVREDVSYAGSRKVCAQLYTKTSIAVSRYVLSMIDRKQAHAFIEDLLYGEGLKRGDAAFAVRNHMLDIHAKTGLRISENSYIIAVIFKAWNFYRKDKQCLRISFHVDKEDFPTPI